MIPLKNDIPTRFRPYLVYVILGLNVLVWLVELLMVLSSRSTFHDFLYSFGLVPGQLFSQFSLKEIGTIFSSMFLHDAPSPIHVGFNMLFLWVFGRNTEDAFGHFWFVPFYLFCGAVGALLHSVTIPSSETVLIGASGAISGLLGAYLILYPRSRIVSLIFLFFFIRLIYLPAWVFIGIWFLYQLIYTFSSFGAGGGGIAFLAHLGGFVAGLLLALLFRKKLRRNVTPQVFSFR